MEDYWQRLLRKVPEDPVKLTGEIWGVTAYFNPAGYIKKLENLKLFSQRVRKQGLKLLIIELAGYGSSFEIADDLGDTVIRLRSSAVLWQKERLLNLAIESLPDNCDKVVWLDADILFTNDSWAFETERLLQRYKVVQPFHLATWLPPDAVGLPELQPDTINPPDVPYCPGIAFASLWYPPEVDLVSRADLAHPGFAWAARRSVLATHGLYDRFIIGGGDLVTTAAMFTPSRAWKMRRLSTCFCEPQIRDMVSWTDAFHETVQGSVFCVAGTVLHLWHGNIANRKYVARHRVLKESEFDPRVDIELDESGCWRWSSDKPLLHQGVKTYFFLRRENGDLPVSATGAQSKPST